jgi:energy-converting hydrogenase B subunit Q
VPRRQPEPGDPSPGLPQGASRAVPRAAPQALPAAVALRLEIVDEAGAISVIAGQVAAAGGRVRTLSTVRRAPSPGAADQPIADLELEVEGVGEHALVVALEDLREVIAIHLTRPLDKVFGKRVIVVGGGAQVAQVALGAVSEADRHNLRGERISVDTIPLVGEDAIASAVRAVADLPRARLLVLAGSIMGGEISRAAEELRAVGIPIIALNMVGSITDHVDLVISDPVQAGTMAVMAVADTATFDLTRQRGRRY